MYKQLGYSLALLFLGRMTAYDIRWKKIPAVWVAAAGIVAVIYFAMGKQCSINTAVLCMLPGFVLLLLSALTGERIGYGDGMTALVIGFLIGGDFCAAVVCLAIMMTGIYSLYQILRKCREPIPLIPFFLGAMEVMLVYA